MERTVGKLYIVATPIGNLADITFRAVETLKNVDLIAAEDTRTTGVLLEKYGIKTPLVSYHKFCENEKAEPLIEKIKGGQNIALVSDAGTPLISDPGNVLVKTALKNGITPVPIGGVSALTTLVCAVSRKGEDFKFAGFLPRVKNQIEDLIKENRFENLIFYQSPNRIKETFEIIQNVRSGAVLSIGRELTKKFEEIITADISDIITYYEKNPLKGEIVCMLHKSLAPRGTEELKEKICALKNAGFTQKQTAIILNITDCAPKNLVKSLFSEQETG